MDVFGQIVVISQCFVLCVILASKESDKEYGEQDNDKNCGYPDIVR